MWGSNPQPSDYMSDALPIELTRQGHFDHILWGSDYTDTVFTDLHQYFKWLGRGLNPQPGERACVRITVQERMKAYPLGYAFINVYIFFKMADSR